MKSLMIKFGFSIKTRDGLVVDNLIVAAPSRAAAEHKIAQIHPHCKVLVCHELQQQVVKDGGLSLENAITLIGEEADPNIPAKKD